MKSICGRRGRLLGMVSATALIAVATAPATLAAGASPQVAQAAAVHAFAIPAKPLAQALDDFGRITGLSIVYTGDIPSAVVAQPVSGTLEAEEALRLLLGGTGFIHRYTDAGTVTLERVAAQGATVLDPVRVEGRAAKATQPPADTTGAYVTPITRSATRLDLSPRETPQAVTVMTRQRIEDQQLQEITEVMEQTVGVSYSQGGALGSDANSIYARGFQVQNFQVDGAARSRKYGYTDEIADLAVYDRVEVVRGATGLMSGTGDPSASVNLVRKRATAEPQATVSAQVGTWNRYRGEGDVSGALFGNDRLRARMVAAYQEGESFIDRLENRKQVLFGTIEGDLTDTTTVRAGIEYQSHRADDASRGGVPLFFADGGLTNFDRSKNSAASWAYFDNTQLTTFAAVEHGFDNDWTISVDLERAERRYDGLIGYGIRGTLDRATGTGMGIWPGRWVGTPEQYTGSVNATGPFTLFGRRHDLMLGASAFHANNEDPSYPLWWLTGYNPNIPNYYTWQGEIGYPPVPQDGVYEFTERQVAGYAATRLRPTDALSVILGGRVTSWKQENETRPFVGAATFSEQSESGVLTPYAGVVYDLDEVWSVYGSYTSIFKPQDNKDAAGQYLDPLVGNAYEAGVKAEFLDGRMTASMALFHIQQDNLAVADGAKLTPDGGQAYKAEEGATSQGIEIELAGEPLAGWQIGGGYARALPEDSDGARLQTDVPRDTVKLFSTYRLPGDLDRLTIGGNVRWQGTTYASGVSPTGGSYIQDPFAVVDLMAAYDVTDDVTMKLNVKNVFDEHYYTSIGANGYAGEPVNALLTVTARF